MAEKTFYPEAFKAPETADYKVEVVQLTMDVPLPAMKTRFAVVHKPTGVITVVSPSFPEALSIMHGQQEALDQLIASQVPVPPGRSN